MSSKMITLRSSDWETFEVEAVAVESQTIKHMIEDECADNVIPLPNVTSNILSKVIEYCSRHVHADRSSSENELKTFDAEFVKVDRPTLFGLIVAGNYLNIKGLINLTWQTVADMIVDFSPQQVRELFDIENDFTPEEEAAVPRRMNGHLSDSPLDANKPCGMT